MGATVSEMLENAIARLLDENSRRALRRLLLTPVEPGRLDQELGQLAMFAQPAYLPFAMSSDVGYALYVRPGVSLEASPIVRLDPDGQGVHVAAGALTRGRAAMLVLAGELLFDWDAALSAVDELWANVPGMAPVSAELSALVRGFDDADLQLWSASAKQRSRDVWATDDLAHPFARAPALSYAMEVADALPVVERYCGGASEQPEIESLLLCTRARAGVAPAPDRVSEVLGAEAWRDRGLVSRGFWRVEGEGLCEWDATLQAAGEVDGALTGPFERLRSHPRLYSGEDDEAVDVLVEVGREFERAGDWETALNQYRNAAAVAGLSGAYLGRVTRQEVHDAIANACDQIEPGCLAAEVARVSARAIAAGL